MTERSVAAGGKGLKGKSKGKGKGMQELTEESDEPLNESNVGSLSLCQVQDSIREIRNDETDRKITFAIDSAACTTIVPSRHQAARG